MTRDELSNEYFEWLYSLVCNDQYNKNLTFRKLLMYLHKVEFIYIFERDDSRAVDGIDFRYRFGLENGYSRKTIEECLDFRPCSVFEMMVGLAARLEDQIMDDNDYGNRTGQWFWNMIVSLGLGNMCDNHFDKGYVEQVVDRFLNREYSYNGEGGLFTIDNPRYDLADTEIWYQAMWYLNQVLDE